MKLFKSKKAVAVGFAAGIALGLTGVAVAYFTTDGAGNGTATVGTSTSLVLHQATIAYSNTPTNVLLPGTSATVNFTVDNSSTGNQHLGTISVASITSDKTGCSTAEHSAWFDISDTNVVDANYGPGAGQSVTGDLTVAFVNDTLAPQDECKGALLTINYVSN